MALTAGARLGIYEVTARLGEGGMGQVHRARDTKLNRDVALKVLPDSFANDAERLARFTREAQTLASLNHPNIAHIHGLEESNGVRALVMELVEGEDLSDRLARGAIPFSEALPIAKQIAEALEAAHEHGIIHRDLKPANIKVRADGTVKVLDFGLAKATDPPGARSPNASQSPTITTPAMSHAGMILGTAAYMSPEQAKGRTVDRRADVWAFGAVLYEILTGQRAFAGEDVSDTLANVLKREPDWERLPADVPARIRQVLRACLQKNVKQRIADAQDVRLALEGAFETTVPQTSAAPRGRLAWLTALAVATVLAAGVAAIFSLPRLRGTPPVPSESRLHIVTPATDDPTSFTLSRSFALSPDGRQIVFVASGDGASRLWLRPLATTTAQPLAGTEGAMHPFWAPGGRSVAFFAGGALKRLDLGGGSPQTLAPAENGSGGTWNTENVILFAPSANSALMRVSASAGGGVAAAVTRIDPQQQGHAYPQFLPDGHRFLFVVIGTADTAGIYLGALDGSTATRLTPSGGSGQYLPSGFLVWVRAGTLVAQRLDLSQAALTGEPVTLADGVAAVSVAATGLVAYRDLAGSPRQLTWVDRSGTVRGTVGDPDPSLSNPRVSSIGRRIVVERTVQGNTDLWLLDGTRTSKFTFDAAADRFPIWSPDGGRLVFRSNRESLGDIYQKLTSSSVEDRFVSSDELKAPSSWSADGRFVLYHSIDQTIGDIWVVPMTGDRTPSVFLKTAFREAYPAFSPDGRWVAYQSNESGRSEIYVRPFVPPGAAGAGSDTGRLPVSSAGGMHPAWRPDGKELYYLNPAGAMMAAPITVTGSTLEAGAPVVLFPTRIASGGEDDTRGRQGRQYDVAADGRFLINTILDRADVPITLLMNWDPEAKK